MALGARFVPEAPEGFSGTEVGVGAVLKAGCTATFVVAVGNMGGVPCVLLLVMETSYKPGLGS
jgi:hypothetical protein